MKITCLFLCLFFFCSIARAKQSVYHGSTPAHRDMRIFLNISLVDSIDFIKWHLTIEPGKYELSCKYGLAKAGTDGFTNERQVRFTGKAQIEGYHHVLNADGRICYLLEINTNLLHLLDKQKNMLVGNGGYSYTLNVYSPLKTDRLNVRSMETRSKKEAAFEGRTPCQELFFSWI